MCFIATHPYSESSQSATAYKACARCAIRNRSFKSEGAPNSKSQSSGLRVARSIKVCSVIVMPSPRESSSEPSPRGAFHLVPFSRGHPPVSS